jgi:RNA polymerase sigma-70 factor (ECF subfamily)
LPGTGRTKLVSGSVTPSDEDLVVEILAGRPELFSVVVERYQGRLVNYLARMVRSLDDAHDLTQEVFLKVYQALDRFDPQYRFSTWVFRVAQNTAIDQMRRRKLRATSSLSQTVDGEEHEWDPPGSERGPYGETRNRERAVAIERAIAELPPEYRELIEMRHFGDLAYEEIAALRRLPLGTVKNKLFRARQLLKVQLADFLTD